MGTYQANADVLQGIELVATIDSDTTVICLDLDGTIYALDDPNLQLPPFHYQCRTVPAPVVDWDALGREPPPEGTRSARDFSNVSEEELERGGRGRVGEVTRIPTSVKGEQWLRDQPQRVQEKMLGVGKAKLFRDGDISLSDILRRDNSTVPLSELGGE